jgi:hypothetical protein
MNLRRRIFGLVSLRRQSQLRSSFYSAVEEKREYYEPDF